MRSHCATTVSICTLRERERERENLIDSGLFTTYLPSLIAIYRQGEGMNRAGFNNSSEIIK
jgi:hypothetical protein